MMGLLKHSEFACGCMMKGSTSRDFAARNIYIYELCC